MFMHIGALQKADRLKSLRAGILWPWLLLEAFSLGRRIMKTAQHSGEEEAVVQGDPVLVEFVKEMAL